MESEVKIRTGDGKIIYGRLRGELSKPLVIFVHGLTGHMDEHIFYNGARFFEQHGYASYRFNQYDGEKGARRLLDSTIRSQASDLETVAKYLQKRGAKTIYAVGHSYGGPTILSAPDHYFRAVVLWDPTLKRIFTRKDTTSPLAGSNHYLIHWAYDVVISRAMYEEGRHLDSAKLAQQFHSPTRIILAEKGTLQEWPTAKQQWQKAFPGQHEVVILKNSDHNFYTDDTAEQLLAKTLAWFQQYR